MNTVELIRLCSIDELSKEQLVKYADQQATAGNSSEPIIEILVQKDSSSFSVESHVRLLAEFENIEILPSKESAIELILFYIESHRNNELATLETAQHIRKIYNNHLEQFFPYEKFIGEELNLFPILSKIYEYEDVLEQDPLFKHKNKSEHTLKQVVGELAEAINAYSPKAI